MSSSESEQAVRKSEEGQPSDRPSARGSTIIVDPGLIAEAERLTESQRPRAISSEIDLAEAEPNASEARSADSESNDSDSAEGELTNSELTDSEGSEPLDLSFEEAERFANAFRASWEPSVPTPSAAPAPVYVPAAPIPHVPEAIHAPVLISDLPGANRRRTVMLASGAVAGFLAILLLGWLASRSGAPDHPATDNPLANTAPVAPAAPKLEAAPEPAKAVEPPVPAPATEAVAAAPAPVEPAGAATEPGEPIAVAPNLAPAAAPVVPAEAAAPPAAVEPPPAQPEPILVALQITAQPAHARLTLDGSPISNPYDAQHPQGGSHVVEASAPGYQARNLKIELTKKRSVALELQRERAAEPAPAPRAVKKAERRPKPQRAAKPAKPAKKVATFVEESPY